MDGVTFPLVGSRSRALGLRMLRDERLVVLAAAGEVQAFAVIYERHHADLYRYCRSILANAEDAADALQNTMLNAYRALSSSKKDVALRPWLFRIAHNESISLLRRRRPHAELDEAVDASRPGLEGDAETRERLRQLVDDMRTLPEGQRGALVMRELSGLSYTDVGLALDVSSAAAKQLVYEAHTSLNQIAEGRAMDCDAVRRVISAGDRRVLRGRKLSAHLRSCDGCQGFRDGLKARRADLMALAPPLPVGAAAAVFSSLFGGGGGIGGGGLMAGGGSLAAGGGAGGGALSGGGGGGLWAGITGGGGGGGLLAGVTGGGNVVAGSAATKALVPVVVTLGVGAGGLGLSEETRRERAKDARPALQVPAPRTLHDGRTPLERALTHAKPADLAFGSPAAPPPGSIEATLPPVPVIEGLAPVVVPEVVAEPLAPVDDPVPFESEGEVVQVPVDLDGTVVADVPAPRQDIPEAGVDEPPAPALPAAPGDEEPLPDDEGPVAAGSPDPEPDPSEETPEPDPDPAPVR